MSRFKPSFLQQPTTSASPLYTPAPAGIARSPQPQQIVAATDIHPDPSAIVSPFETLGYVLYASYLLSGLLNEWTIRLFGNSAHVSQISLALLPVALLLSRTRWRGLRHNMGLWWIAFLFFLLLDAPFSYWRTGTADVIGNYVGRSYSLYFFITAFMVTLNRCRGLMFFNVIFSAIVLFNCLTIGVFSADGRFYLANSLFFSNSNDLALQLLIGIVQFVYLFHERGIFKKLFATACIALSCIYMLRTGSRGCVLSAICYCVFLLFFSRSRVFVLILMLLAGAAGLASVPSTAFRRLVTFSFEENSSAAGSEMQRKELFRRSIVETFKHPVFGVGPGQFAAYVVGEHEKKGEWAAWVGTHNSYTEVSAECGLPAFVCYCAVIVLCFRLNYRVLRLTRDDPAHQRAAALSFTLLGTTVVYSVSTFFFHMAYSSALPALSGLTVALYLAVKPVIEAVPAGAPTR